MSEKFKIGADITSFENNGTRLPISRVTLYVDDETVFTSGDDTGTELSARCDFATQEMADNILAQVQGFAYTAYSAGAANLDPAAELGDGATVGGVYSIIARVVDDGMGYPDIEAPGEKEVDEEFPFESPTTQEMRRKLAETRAQLKVMYDEITAEIQALDDDVTGKYTKLTQTVEGFTFEDENGTVYIDGGKVDAEGLTVDAANITGELTIGQLPSDVATTDDVPTNTSDLTNDSGFQTERGVTSIINGTVTTDYVNALGITAYSIAGSAINVKDGSGSIYGIMYAGTNTANSTAFEVRGTTGLRLTAAGNVFLQCSGQAALTLSGSNATIGPNLWLSSGTQITSDRKKKKDIQYMDDLDNAEIAAKYDAFLDLLKFARFKYQDGTSDRYHSALIADDVETAIEAAELTTQDVAAFCKIPIYATDENNNPTEEIVDYTCALRYDEFIGILIRRAQQLTLRTTALEAELAETKNTLLKFEERLTALGV